MNTYNELFERAEKSYVERDFQTALECFEVILSLLIIMNFN